MESPKISFVGPASEGIVEKGQIYDNNISTALSNKNKAFLSTEIGPKIWLFLQILGSGHEIDRVQIFFPNSD